MKKCGNSGSEFGGKWKFPEGINTNSIEKHFLSPFVPDADWRSFRHYFKVTVTFADGFTFSSTAQGYLSTSNYEGKTQKNIVPSKNRLFEIVREAVDIHTREVCKVYGSMIGRSITDSEIEAIVILSLQSDIAGIIHYLQNPGQAEEYANQYLRQIAEQLKQLAESRNENNTKFIPLKPPANPEIKEKNDAYCIARAYMKKNTADSLQTAIEKFQALSGWADSDEQVIAC